MLTTLIAVSSAAAITPEAVLNTPAREVEPVHADGYFGWAQANLATPRRFNVFVLPDGGSRFRVNPSNTVAFMGDIDGTTLVYGQRPGVNYASNIKFFDLTTRMLIDPPPGVNTIRNDEVIPKLSGNHLLFARFTATAGSVRLYDLTTHTTKVLDSLAYPGYVQPGRVEGNWAVWTKCKRFAHCNTFVYDIANRTKTRVPNPLSRSQYAASVTADGTVYFGESTNINCGSSLAIWRYPIGGPREKLLPISRGRDIATLDVVENVDGSTTVYYDRYICNTWGVDIYRFTFGP